MRSLCVDQAQSAPVSADSLFRRLGTRVVPMSWALHGRVSRYAVLSIVATLVGLLLYSPADAFLPTCKGVQTELTEQRWKNFQTGVDYDFFSTGEMTGKETASTGREDLSWVYGLKQINPGSPVCQITLYSSTGPCAGDVFGYFIVQNGPALTFSVNPPVFEPPLFPESFVSKCSDVYKNFTISPR
jgi:hypothetical protein